MEFHEFRRRRASGSRGGLVAITLATSCRTVATCGLCGESVSCSAKWPRTKRFSSFIDDHYCDQAEKVAFLPDDGNVFAFRWHRRGETIRQNEARKAYIARQAGISAA